MRINYVVASPLSNVIPTRPIAQDSRSPHLLTVINSWVMNCIENHADCKSSLPTSSRQTLHELPTRVIDVGLPDATQEPYLFVTDARKGKWIALSHCWGSKPFLCTLKANIARLRISIAVSEMPRTFQDAVTLVRALGYRYLWIDSICIIQDSKEDWQVESARMPAIYANAEFTIAAGATEDSRGGLFHTRNQPPTTTMQLAFNHSMAELVLQDRHGHKEPSYLQFRAWCLQEQILSRRILSFEPNDIKWHCCGISLEETLPLIQAHEQFRGNSRSFQLSIQGAPEKQANRAQGSESDGKMLTPIPRTQRSISIANMWYSIVSSYTTRQLTFSSDKLTALGGIATLINDSLSDTYLAGLWKRDLPDCLLWEVAWQPETVFPPAPRVSSPHIIPSWSWASLNKPIHFPRPIRHFVDGTVFPDGPVCTVISASTNLVTPNPFGHVDGGSITLKTRLRSQKCSYTASPDFWWIEDKPNRHECRQDSIAYAGYWIQCYFDDTRLSDEELTFIQISFDSGLIARRAESGARDFRRVGVFRMEEDPWYPLQDWFEKCDWEEVTLI
jgi:hypothetical protein